MPISRRAYSWMASGYAIASLLLLSASAHATVLFDSLDSPTTGNADSVFFPYPLAASFETGASAFHLTDLALLLNQSGVVEPSYTFTVSLGGGVPLADVMFDPLLGLNVGPGGPFLDSVTAPISELSTSPTASHFNEFAGITLQANSLYWIQIEVSTDSADSSLGWGTTNDNSGVGVAAGYNSTMETDFTFFPNNGFGGGQAFQMKVSGAVPEPSTWAMMLLGFAGLGYAGYRRCGVLARA